MLKKVALLFLLSTPAYSESPYEECKKERSACTEQLEGILESNEELIEKLKNTETSTPQIQLENLTVTIDKEGRVFIKENLKGKLQIGKLNYDIMVKIKPQILKAVKPKSGFQLRPKAYILSSYELGLDDKVKQHISGALGLDLFHYEYLNLNLLLGYRIYGPAIGIDVTEHFSLVSGIGFKYNDDKAPFVGAAFDF